MLQKWFGERDVAPTPVVGGALGGALTGGFAASPAKPLTRANVEKILEVVSKVNKGLREKPLLYYLDEWMKHKLLARQKPPGETSVIDISPAVLRQAKKDTLGDLYHEYTHVFAGTDDNGYLNDRTDPAVYWKSTGGSPSWKYVQLSSEQLTNNADTYLGFLTDGYLGHMTD